MRHSDTPPFGAGLALSKSRVAFSCSGLRHQRGVFLVTATDAAWQRRVRESRKCVAWGVCQLDKRPTDRNTGLGAPKPWSTDDGGRAPKNHAGAGWGIRPSVDHFRLSAVAVEEYRRRHG